MTTGASQLRIFFALWPDAATREGLAVIAAGMPLSRAARRVPDYNLHLTLHFIGNVDAGIADCMRREARAVEAEAFELAIDNSGHFRGAGVGWLGSSEVPAALDDLHRLLGDRLQNCGYTPEPQAYRPHVTVARKLDAAPASFAFAALRWKIDNFVLLESRPGERGVRYRVVESYPLT